MVNGMKGNSKRNVFFVCLTLVILTIITLVFFFKNKSLVLCSIKNESVICGDVVDVNLNGVKLYDITNKKIYIYDEDLFNSDVRYYSYVTSKKEIKTLSEIINDANRVNPGNNKIKIMKIDKESKYIIANDWDDNYTRDTINIDGEIVFISDSDVGKFDYFYGEVFRKYKN